MSKDDDYGPTNIGPPPSEHEIQAAEQWSKGDSPPPFSCEHGPGGCYHCRVEAGELPLPTWEPAGDRERRYREYKSTSVWPRIGPDRYRLGDIIVEKNLYREDVEDPDDPGWDRSESNTLVLDYR